MWMEIIGGREGEEEAGAAEATDTGPFEDWGLVGWHKGGTLFAVVFCLLFSCCLLSSKVA